MGKGRKTSNLLSANAIGNCSAQGMAGANPPASIPLTISTPTWNRGRPLAVPLRIGQYSSGRRMVVTLRSASVITHRRVSFFVR